MQYITVMGAVVVDKKYIYAMVDDDDTVSNVIDHLPDVVRNTDREQFRKILSSLNTASAISKAAVVCTETVFNNMRQLLQNYINLRNVVTVDVDGTLRCSTYNGNVFEVSNISDPQPTTQEAIESVLPKGTTTVINMGGNRLYRILPTDIGLISEYDPPLGQQQKFIDRGITTPPIKRFKYGTTVARVEYGNWHGRHLYLSNLD